LDLNPPSASFFLNDLRWHPVHASLSVNGERSLVIDMADAHLAPEGWTRLGYEKPALDSFNDIAIYELHIRDFRYDFLGVRIP
jgi:pullulanase/glycogen debranching enzyme